MENKVKLLLNKFYIWYAQSQMIKDRNEYKHSFTREFILNSSDYDLINAICEFAKEGGGIQSGGERTGPRLRASIKKDLNDFRKYLLSVWDNDFDIIKWIDNKDFKGWGIGVKTIFLHRIFPDKYIPSNNKTKDGSELLKIYPEKIWGESEGELYLKIIKSVNRFMLSYDAENLNFSKFDALMQYMIGEPKSDSGIKNFIESLFPETINSVSANVENQKIYRNDEYKNKLPNKFSMETLNKLKLNSINNQKKENSYQEKIQESENEENDNNRIFKMSLGDSSLKEESEQIYKYCINNNEIALGWGRDVDFSSVKTKEEIKQIINNRPDKFKNSPNFEKENNDSYYNENGPSATGFIYQFNTLKKGDIILVSEGEKYIKAIGEVLDDNCKYNPNTEIESYSFCHFRNVNWLKILKDHEFDFKILYGGTGIDRKTIYELKNKINREYLNKFIQENLNNYIEAEDLLNKLIENPNNLTEGEKKYFQSVRYERNPKNREIALRIHNRICKACGFDFNFFYGDGLARGFIEVHHIKPLSEGIQEIDPEKDLIPLCSNCHSMIHREVEMPNAFSEIENRYKQT